jgi:hypothetical protein
MMVQKEALLHYGKGKRLRRIIMAELSHDDAIEVLGPISDVIIAEIIATGVSKAELVAARDRVIADRKAHDSGTPMQPGRFARVVDILERSRARGLLGEAGSTLE